MTDYFTKGDKIILQNGQSAKIIEKLGEGGQGVVYKILVNGTEYALKWYHKNAVVNPKKFYRNLENNVKNGAPTSSFLWPLFLSERQNESFGYVMALRAKNYYEFSDFLLARVHFESLTAAVNSALNITNGFRELHRKGYSYQDLNNGNFFINPKNGDILICDNDNVAPYGESLGIAGKARYMAPEVVRNLKRPDVMTDRFSLAVILFRLLFLDHPLEGRRVIEQPCLTEALELKFYGKEPVFIYDKDDDSNRPVHGVHANVLQFWWMYPKFIRDAFTNAFSKSAMMGNAPRPTDNDWQLLFTNLRECIVQCPCGYETFLDFDSDSLCINCGFKIPKPPILTLQHKYQVVLFPGMKLYRCHTDAQSDSYTEVTGEVIRNLKNPAIWGLRNCSSDIWNAESKSGELKQIKPNDVLVVVKTKQIQFGNVVGIISE